MMNKRIPKILLVKMLLLYCSMMVYAQKTPEWVLPTTPFNEAETAKLMEKGTAVIQGTATLKKREKIILALKGARFCYSR